MSTIRCDIVSAEKEIFHGNVSMVIATGEMGELGIAPRHAPLITRLKPGQVRLKLENGEEQFFYVSGGILEVQPQVVTVLADTAERAADLDEAAARKAKDEAERAIANRVDALEIAEAQAQLAQALASCRRSNNCVAVSSTDKRRESRTGSREWVKAELFRVQIPDSQPLRFRKRLQPLVPSPGAMLFPQRAERHRA